MYYKWFTNIVDITESALEFCVSTNAIILLLHLFAQLKKLKVIDFVVSINHEGDKH